MNSVLPNDLAAEFRAELARRLLPIYVIAPKVGVHPVRLGRMLSGKVPMPPAVAERIRAAIQPEETLAK